MFVLWPSPQVITLHQPHEHECHIVFIQPTDCCLKPPDCVSTCDCVGACVSVCGCVSVVVCVGVCVCVCVCVCVVCGVCTRSLMCVIHRTPAWTTNQRKGQ